MRARRAATSFSAFDTNVVITVRTEGLIAHEVLGELEEMAHHFESRFSRFIATSDIARLNAARGEKVVVHPDTYELLEAAQFYCANSQDIFDVTIGAVSKLWDFKAGRVPLEEERVQALKHVDYKAITLNKDGDTFMVHLADPAASVDAGGIAKGFIADKMSEALLAHGIDSFLLNLGGNIVAHGTRDGNTPWRVSVRDPQNPSINMLSLPLTEGSVVTSGTYERCFAYNGAHYHHILHPKTGLPVQTDLLSATVVAARSIDAEGYSTTLLALGSEGAQRLVAHHPEILAAYLITDQGVVIACE